MSNFFPDQLKFYRIERGLSQQELAEKLGFNSKQRISDYENGRTEPALADVIKIATLFEVSLDELITKTAKKYENTLPTENKAAENSMGYPKQKSLQNNNHFLTVVPAEAQAGYVDNFNDEKYLGKLPKITLNSYFDCDTIFPVSGDSMYATYTNGDMLICRKMESLKYIEFGEPYVFYLNGRFTVKRLFKTEDPDVLMAVSDNKFYEPFTIEKRDIKGLYIVRGSITKNTGVRRTIEDQLRGMGE